MESKRRVIITTENEPIDKPENTVYITMDAWDMYFDAEKLIKYIKCGYRMAADEIIIQTDRRKK